MLRSPIPETHPLAEKAVGISERAAVREVRRVVGDCEGTVQRWVAANLI